MLQRTLAIFALGVAAMLFGASQTDAQPPGKGGFGKGGFGKGPGPDVQKLEEELDKLQEQVKDLQAKIERAKKGGPGGRDFGKGGFGKGGFGKDFGKGKRPDMKKEGDKKEMAKGGFPGFGRGGFDSANVKEKFEYYKKLYEQSKAEPKEKKEAGKGRERERESNNSVEARLDRLTRELEELRREVRGGEKKKKF
jgi:hypothetical protein